MVVPLRLSRSCDYKKGKRIAEDSFTKQGVQRKPELGCLRLLNWRENLLEDTRKANIDKLFDLTSIGVADDDVYKAALIVEDEVYKEATSLSDYKTRMAAKYDAVIPTSVCGQNQSKEAAQRLFLTAQTYFDDDNFRTSLDPPQPKDTSATREAAIRFEKKRVICQSNFSSAFGNPCGLLPSHRRLARATYSALLDFFGGRLQPGAQAFNAHFKASDANRKAAIGYAFDPEGHGIVHVQPNFELKDVDKAIEQYYFI